MNYKHSYHAGSFADVLKHWVEMLIVQNLQKKETPLIYIDTHSGSGLYDLESESARMTNEAKAGIETLWNTQAKLTPSLLSYLEIIRKFQPNSTELRYYPGSPHVARSILRPQDRMLLNELHPEEAALLKEEFRQDSQVSVHSQNAYQWLLGALPPKIPRGLILIDPPYENPEEYDQLSKLVMSSLLRFRQGIFALWYPITQKSGMPKLRQTLKDASIDKILDIQLNVHDFDSPIGLNGSGMLIINPPWQLDTQIEESLGVLWEILSPKKKGGFSVNLI